MNRLKQFIQEARENDPDGWKCFKFTCIVALAGFLVALVLILGWCWAFGVPKP